MAARRGTPYDAPLSERFKKGGPKRNASDRGSPLTLEEQQYIVWRFGIWAGSRARIGRELRVHRSTVSAYIQDL